MRADQITFSRFIAAISIVIFHFAEFVFPFQFEEVSFLFRHANVGVSYFYILSGFVMILAYSDRPRIDKFQYWKNRFARIYPVYFISTILFFALKLMSTMPSDPRVLLGNVFLLQAWIPGIIMGFNFPGWSLSVEMFFYLVFPFLYNFIFSKYSFRQLIVPTILIWLLTQVVFHYLLSTAFYEGFPSTSYEFLYFFPAMHINEFLIGNIAGLFYVSKLAARKINADIFIVALLAMLCAALKYVSAINFHNGALAVLFVPLIILQAMNRGWLAKISCTKPCLFLGEISYGVYILQLPVYYGGYEIMKRAGFGSEEVRFYICFALLLLSSGLIYRFLETPLRLAIKKYHKRASLN